MSSIPKIFPWLTPILGLLLSSGCARVAERFGNFQDHMHDRFSALARPSQTRLDPVLPDPAPDEAAAVRGWEPQTYNYPNGGMIAGPTYNLNYEDRPRWLANDEAYAGAQAGILAVNILLMPFYMVVEPPLYPVTYHGSRYGPSMTIAPPMPGQ